VKIVLFNIKDRLSIEQQSILSSLGDVSYIKDLNELPIDKLIEIASGAEIIGVHIFQT